MRRAVVTAVLAILCLTAITACGSDDSDSNGEGSSAEQVKIGVVSKFLAEEYWRLVKAGVDKAAADLGDSAEVEFVASKSQTEATDQISEIENMLTRGVDALAVAPNLPDQLKPVLKRVADADIPIILIDTDIPDLPGKVSYVGTDNVKAGVAAGDFVKEQMGSAGGTIGIVVALKGVTSVDDREAGFKEALDGTKVKWFETAQTGCQASKATSIVENALTRDSSITGFFSSCGGIMRQAIKAAKAAGRDVQDMVFTEVDFSPELQEAEFKAGTLDAAIAQFPQKMGEEAVKTAVAAARGEKVPPVIDTGAETVTPANFDDYVQEFKDALKGE